MFSFIKKLFKIEKLDYTELMEREAIIIDVRSPQEFANGHADNSINIPLGEIINHIAELKQKNKPIITCCRSGARSGRATTTLKKAGIEAYNAGSWNQVQASLVA